ncbi:MAG TPA: NADPH-dependent F420 reductase, partial [Anaerolineae bacterium]
IAIIGTGNVGSTLGKGWAAKGHQVIFGTRDPNTAKVRDLLETAGSNTSAALVQEAVAAADIVVLATPWAATQQIVEAVAGWTGKIVVDCTNPIAPGLQLALGTTTSGGEQIAAWAAGARVVKAFNTTGTENMAEPIYDSQPITMFICGDDSEAKAAVTQLAEDLGFEVADTGPLMTARFLEPLAIVWIRLAVVQGWGRDMAFKIVKR